MKGLYITCDKDFFQEMEMMLFEAYFENEPWFEYIKLYCDNDIFTYIPEKIGNKWCIVTN